MPTINQPAGLLLLAGLDPNPMRLFVSVCLLVIAVSMLSGLAQGLAPGKHRARWVRCWWALDADWPSVASAWRPASGFAPLLQPTWAKVGSAL